PRSRTSRRAPRMGPRPRATRRTAAQRLVGAAIAGVKLPRLGAAEYIEGRLHLLNISFGLGVAGVAIGMVFTGHSAVRLLNPLRRCLAAYSQCFVMVYRHAFIVSVSNHGLRFLTILPVGGPKDSVSGCWRHVLDFHRSDIAESPRFIVFRE